MKQSLKPDTPAGNRHHQSQAAWSFVIHNAWLIDWKQVIARPLAQWRTQSA
jgi:hypothetical protein